MKKFTLMLTYIILALLLTGFSAVSGPNDFVFTIENDVQTSDHTLEFDLYLLDTDASQPFELSMAQAGILINPAIYNGGTVNVSIVTGSSQLVPAQQPGSLVWSQAQNTIKLTPMLPTAQGLGTIISSTSIGTRVCRLQISNSVPFSTNSQSNLAFSFLVSPYPTRVFQTIDGFSVQMPCSSTNCFSNIQNPLLNAPSCPVTTIATLNNLCPGSPVQVPVNVTNFIQVGSVSLTLNYDVTVLDFISGVNTSNYPGLTINEPTAGVIKIGGFSSDPQGISLTNNAALFTLNFNYLGGSAAISFNLTNPTDNEYAGIPPLYIPYNDIPEANYYFNGSVSGDQVDPGITCPSNVSVTASAGNCFVLNPALGTPLTSDNCAVNTVSNNFSTLFPNGEVPIGVHSITWTVTDFNNNSATCTQTLTVLQGADPTFNAIGPFCQNSVAPALPTTSFNGISGTWNPSTINTSTAGIFNYLFTPDATECSNPVTVQITIDEKLTPLFDQLGPYCVNFTPVQLSLTSNNGVNGTWYPAEINTTQPGTFSYTFTPDAGECANTTTMDITIDPFITPQFDAIGPLCQNTTAPLLPATSLNGVAGTWSPSTINTTQVGTTEYTFVPSDMYCTAIVSIFIEVIQSVSPSLAQIGPLCQFSTPPALPLISQNGITGTWNPSTISTELAGTASYTFTPDAAFCSSPVTMDIVITEPVIPSFTEIGSLCQNSVAPLLPTTSNNGISGSWNPDVINTAETGTTVYTFTPDAGLCATTTTMSINIDTQVTPLFTQIGPLCQNSVATLPLTSINNVSGTWFPTTINTELAGSFLFTFTPEAGSCAVSTTMTIVIDAITTPAFTQLGPYCQNSTADLLPLTSNNGIQGTWFPASINTAIPGTFTYTFTPDNLQCTSTATMDVTITPSVIPLFTQIAPLCVNSVAPLLPTISENSIQGTWNPSEISTTAGGTTEYVFTPDPALNPCAASVSMFITVNPLPTATISGSTTTCPGIPVDLTVTLTGTAPWTYYWSDDNGATTHLVNAAASPSVFSVSPSVTTSYIITSVQDANSCSNIGSGTATVTGDEVLPTITCPTPLASYTPDNGCTWTGANLDAVIGDNCGNPTLSYSINGSTVYTSGNANGYAFPVGTTTVTYLVVDGSGNENSCTFQIVVEGVGVSGNISYYNTSGTPMNNVQINLIQESVIIQTVTTDAAGNYQFAAVCPGTYNVSFSTIKQAGGINATDAAQLNAWGVGPQYGIEKVRFLAGDVIGPDIINATDAARVLTHFVTSGNPAFASQWTFWNAGEMVTENIPQSTVLTLDVPTSVSTVTANFYALVTGDFNRSFNPAPTKNAAMLDGLTLEHSGVVKIYPQEIFTLPLYAGTDMQISAISLILQFPVDRLEILGVYLGNDTLVPMEYAIIGDQLRIGWQSLIPLSASAGDAVVTIKVKNHGRIEENEILALNLYPDTLNELANEYYEVIYGASLTISDIAGNTVDSPQNQISNALTLNSYPNPFTGKVTLSYNLPVNGKIAFEVSSMMGEKMITVREFEQVAYQNDYVLDMSNLAPGVYAVTIFFESIDNEINSKTIKMIKTH